MKHQHSLMAPLNHSDEELKKVATEEDKLQTQWAYFDSCIDTEISFAGNSNQLV